MSAIPGSVPQTVAGSVQPTMPMTTKPVETPKVNETKIEKDTYEKSDPKYDLANLNKKTQAYDRSAAIKAIKSAQSAQESALRDILTKSVAKQGEAFNVTMFGIKFNVGQEDIDKAKEMIEGDGYYSVKSVATRTMDMAKALGGNDPKNIPKLREAVEKSYKDAEKAWGGELPQICYDTQKEIMSRFDEWEKSANA